MTGSDSTSTDGNVVFESIATQSVIVVESAVTVGVASVTCLSSPNPFSHRRSTWTSAPVPSRQHTHVVAFSANVSSGWVRVHRFKIAVFHTDPS